MKPNKFLVAVLVLTFSFLCLLIPLFFLIGTFLASFIPGVSGSWFSEATKIAPWLFPGIVLLLFGLRLAEQRKVDAIIRSVIIIFAIQFLLFFVWRPMADALG